MGVYIKCMKMPASCSRCRFCGFGGIRNELQVCMFNGLNRPESDYGRMEFCPLTEVPPHGDLIDRSKLYEKTAEWEAQALHIVETTMNDEDTTEWRKWSTILTERSAFKFDVADAPTIIEAEGEENG